MGNRREDLCACEDPWATSPPRFADDCTAHDPLLRAVLAELYRWRAEEWDDVDPEFRVPTSFRVMTLAEALAAQVGTHWRHFVGCGGCGAAWPCEPIRDIAERLGVSPQLAAVEA